MSALKAISKSQANMHEKRALGIFCSQTSARLLLFCTDAEALLCLFWFSLFGNGVNLVGGAALVGAEHDDVLAQPIERLFRERRFEELHISSSAVESLLQAKLVLQHELLPLAEQLLVERLDNGVVPRGVRDNQRFVSFGSRLVVLLVEPLACKARGR